MSNRDHRHQPQRNRLLRSDRFRPNTEELCRALEYLARAALRARGRRLRIRLGATRHGGNPAGVRRGTGRVAFPWDDRPRGDLVDLG